MLAWLTGREVDTSCPSCMHNGQRDQAACRNWYVLTPKLTVAESSGGQADEACDEWPNEMRTSSRSAPFRAPPHSPDATCPRARVSALAANWSKQLTAAVRLRMTLRLT